ncbi:hypothetical protein QQF64_009260 [Cirrhinus molitorella]|uniref:Uncharacterized protein n=1 Tax=Cirrhinus molitorella TaxID=172907 RepID=A0ABR3M0N6_9TELE
MLLDCWLYALPGNPIQDMNDCSTSINIPASMVHVEPSVMQALRQASDCWDCDVGLMFNTRQKSEQKVLHTGDMNMWILPRFP